MAELAIDPDVLERELAAELMGDPLDEIAPDDPEGDALEAVRACDEGLELLKQGHDQRLQGLRVAGLQRRGAPSACGKSTP